MGGIISSGWIGNWLHDDGSDDSGALQGMQRTSVYEGPSKDVGHGWDEDCVRS